MAGLTRFARLAARLAGDSERKDDTRADSWKKNHPRLHRGVDLRV
jgi:hypothetical protein